MIKLLGAALIIGAAAGMGWVQSASYAARPKQIRSLITALQRLETSIMYGQVALDEAFAELGEQLPEPLNKLFSDAAKTMRQRDHAVPTAKAAWQQALQDALKRSALKKQEVRILQDFGMSLGVSDREDQRNHIRHAIKRLEQEEQSARDEHSRFGTMYRSLGVLCGVLAVILMY